MGSLESPGFLPLSSLHRCGHPLPRGGPGVSRLVNTSRPVRARPPPVPRRGQVWFWTQEGVAGAGIATYERTPPLPRLERG